MNHNHIDYKWIVNSVPIVSYIILNDDNFTIRFLSKAVEDLTGYPQERFSSGTFFRELIDEEDNNQNADVIEHAIRHKKTNFELEYRINQRSGKRVWVKERGRIVYDDNGKVTYFTGMFWDESELKKAELELKNREELISSILQATEILFSREDYANVIETCLEILGKVNQVHRIYVYQNHILEDQPVTSLKFEWVAEGVKAHIDDPDQQNIPQEAMQEFFDPLRQGNAFEGIVEELEESDLKDHLRAQDIRSILVLPLFVNETFYGFIGFDDIQVKRRFTLLEKQLLVSFTKSVETAIERNQNLEAAKEQTKILETVFQAIDDGVALLDSDMNVLLINEAMEKYTRTAFTKGMHCQALFSEGVQHCDQCVLSDSFDSGRIEYEEREIVINGEVRFIEDVSYPVLENSHAVTNVVKIIRDITERKQFEAKLKAMSETDGLTSLHNRAYFDEQLRSLGRHAEYTIFSLDVDGLKIINDTFGHERGDALLITVAEILRQTIPNSATLARIGGDEYAIILESASKEEINKLYDTILQAFDDYNQHNREFYLSVSLGMAKSTRDQTPFDVLKRADDEMYSQKLRKGQSAKSQIIQTLLETLKTRDYYTKTHGSRMLEHVTKLSKKLGLPPSKINHMQTLAEVHDVGKIGIPDAILLKPDTLTAKEWKLMKTHPEKGYRIALNSPELAAISEFILKHHEHYDGSGYPLGIKGEDIPIESRILLVCDAFDAMTSDRHYRKAMPVDDAIDELLKHRGSQFDPTIVNLFVKDILKRPDKMV